MSSSTSSLGLCLHRPPPAGRPRRPRLRSAPPRKWAAHPLERRDGNAQKPRAAAPPVLLRHRYYMQSCQGMLARRVIPPTTRLIESARHQRGAARTVGKNRRRPTQMLQALVHRRWMRC